MNTNVCKVIIWSLSDIVGKKILAILVSLSPVNCFKDFTLYSGLFLFSKKKANLATSKSIAVKSVTLAESWNLPPFSLKEPLAVCIISNTLLNSGSLNKLKNNELELKDILDKVSNTPSLLLFKSLILSVTYLPTGKPCINLPLSL